MCSNLMDGGALFGVVDKIGYSGCNGCVRKYAHSLALSPMILNTKDLTSSNSDAIRNAASTFIL